MSQHAGGTPTPFAAAGTDIVRVYRGGRLFDGTGDVTHEDTTIVVRGGTIDSVQSDRELDGSLLEQAEVIELDGRCVIPGLIDSHQHLATPPDRAVAEAALRRQVYGGVTAIRDMADDLRQISDLARASLVGEIAGPDIYYAALMAGPSFFDDPRTWQVCQGETPGTVPWMQAITDDSELPIAVALARGTHACAVKIYADLPGDLVAAITAEAHRQGMAVWAHAAVFPATPTDVVTAGVDVVSHVTMLAYETQPEALTTYKGKLPLDHARISVTDPRIDAVLELMLRTGTVLDATASLWTRDEVMQGEDAESLALAKANADLAALLTARAHRAGVPISTGTDYESDPADPFPSLHKELLFLARHCGMSNAEVLRSATAIGARSAGVTQLMGTVEPGKLANFVVLDEDPLQDIEHLKSISLVVKRGHRYDRARYGANPSTSD
jgi:imidazolonepropionase-like amidohydrolase